MSGREGFLLSMVAVVGRNCNDIRKRCCQICTKLLLHSSCRMPACHSHQHDTNHPDEKSLRF